MTQQIKIEKTKEYKDYVKELSKLYLMINVIQKEQLDIVFQKEHELNNKVDELLRIKYK